MTSQKIEESIFLRGISASLQSMEMPQLINLNEMLALIGYRVIEIELDNKIRGFKTNEVFCK